MYCSFAVVFATIALSVGGKTWSIGSRRVKIGPKVDGGWEIRKKLLVGSRMLTSKTAGRLTKTPLQQIILLFLSSQTSSLTSSRTASSLASSVTT